MMMFTSLARRAAPPAPSASTSRPPGGGKGDGTEGPKRDVRAEVSFRNLDHQSAADRDLALAILREYFASLGDGEDAERRYRWLYLDNPHGIARTYAVVENATGAPVGVTSLFPREVQVAGERVHGAIGGDAFVTPRFRRCGLATALHRLAFAGLNQNLAFMFGPPEPNNLKALLQAGAVVTGAVRRYTRALHPRAFGELARKHDAVFHPIARFFAPSESKLRLEPLAGGVDPRVDLVWEKLAAYAASAGAVIPVRDARFYAWRFDGSPNRRQRGHVVLDGDVPVAVCALERSGARVAVVDIACEPSRFKDVVGALTYASRDCDVLDLQIHVPSRRKESVLATMGFVPRAKKPFQVQAQPSFALRASLINAAAWEYTWGDGDVDHVL